MTGSNDKLIDAGSAQLGALIEWALQVRVEDIPREALKRAALGIADDVAVAASMQDEPEIRQFHELLLRMGSTGEATLFRAGAPRTERHAAAAANALAMTASEMDEGFRLAPCRGGLYTVPALLAEAEARDLPVAQVLRAEVLAYEIISRIARAWKASDGPYPRYYSHGRLTALGAAAASALAWDVDARVFLQALSNAATLINVTPSNHLFSGALVRNVWPAAGAWSGMMSLRWAQCGIAGLPTSINDVFSGVLDYVAVPSEFMREIGSEWAVCHTYERIHACHVFFNAIIEAMLQVRARMGEAPIADVEQIALNIHPAALSLVDRAPATTLAARFSVPHVAATALFHGHARTAAFSNATLTMSEIDTLRRKVTVAPFDMSTLGTQVSEEKARPEGAPFALPLKGPAAVTISMRRGATYTARCIDPPGGHHGTPYAHEVVLDKIDALTADRHPHYGSSTRELIELAPRCLEEPWSRFIRGAIGS